MSDVTERTPLPKLTDVSEDGNWLEVGVSSVSARRRAIEFESRHRQWQGRAGPLGPQWEKMNPGTAGQAGLDRPGLPTHPALVHFFHWSPKGLAHGKKLMTCHCLFANSEGLPVLGECSKGKNAFDFAPAEMCQLWGSGDGGAEVLRTFPLRGVLPVRMR